ncbi:DUF11 domain-containing protein [Halobacillus halophilus]|uniref:DUF11 domain-containing protein n=1 Tax=Halobacillus halophilus TaxID=1570 RepID=UPI001CD6C383|nr:DUF11 domain-containing protein [Halobacillus halophilus]MCA1011664.1 DUF11 domain-containing protein [Halobacillus halophilus]
MADICQNCSCSPYENVCECPTNMGITVTQPACQTLPDGSISGNPCFRPSPENRSYWTYKFLTDNAQSTRAISNFLIPICQNILAANIIVSEKIDGCGSFTPVPFTISSSDPNFGNAPMGFNWLKIETNNRFEKGVCVEYRLEIVGNFPVGTQGIRVKAANNNLTFACDGCFLVPECPAPGQLVVDKNCEEIFMDGMATLSFSIEVTNSGGSPLNNVQLTDTLLFSNAINLGPITISDSNLMVDRTVPGRIRITGNLGTLNPGDERFITYSLPVVNVSAPGEYLITNTATVTSMTSEATDFCSLNLDVVQLSADKCCTVNGNQISYRITLENTPNSPDTRANLTDVLTIPAGLTVQFSTIGGCNAMFEGGGEVPLNENITGPRTIVIECMNLTIPQGGSAHRDIQLSIVSSTTQNATINNTLENVELATGDQIDLGTLNVPFSVDTNYVAIITCTNPCPAPINAAVNPTFSSRSDNSDGNCNCS